MKNQVSDNPVKNRDNSVFWLTITACLLVTLYLTSNIMAVKVINIFGITLFDAGTIIFPLSYMLGDALTEIWGFKTTKKIIILTFICNIFMITLTYIGIFLPSPDYMAEVSDAYETVFAYTPRIIIASLIAFLTGELLNAWSMEKIKSKTGDKLLWVRTIGSSTLGHLTDTVIFVCIAFLGVSPAGDLISMIVIQYIAKLGIEAICGTPLAYGIVKYIKRKI